MEDPEIIEPFSFEQAVDFLNDKGVTGTCFSCGADAAGWELTASLEGSDGKPTGRYRGLPTTDENNRLYANVEPIIVVTCNNCGFVKIHSLAKIREICKAEAK